MERIAVVGIGSRFMTLFAKRLKNTYADRATVVGVCDTNRVRCEYYRDSNYVSSGIFKTKNMDFIFRHFLSHSF